MECNIKLIENEHVTNIKKNTIYTNIVEMIINDILMGKIKKTEDGELQLINITDTVKELIEDWNIMASQLKKYNNYSFIVYRGVSNMDDTDIINQPLPFSTCVEFNNALNWVHSNGFVMKINIKVGDLYTFTGNTTEGREVIISPCKLEKISSNKIDGIIINEYNICYDKNF